MKISKKQIRILPVLTVVLVAAFMFRVVDVAQEIAGLGDASAGQARAEDTADKDNDMGSGEDGVSERTAGEDLANPVADRFAKQEIEVLQSLAERREELRQQAAALDEREVLLDATEKRLEQKFAELNKLRGELEELIGEQQDIQKERMARLVKIYETMKPKDAANIFNEMPTPVLLAMLEQMSERKMAPIIAAMDPRRARMISTLLAEEKKLPTP